MDFDKARFNMIEQQIRPWNVLNPQVLSLLSEVKREGFVCETLQSLAFTDCELPIRAQEKNTGEFMLSPKMEARMLQELALTQSDNVLEVGTGTGYTAALMAQQAGRVTTVEINPNIAELARHNLKRNGLPQVKVLDGCGFDLSSNLGLFDVLVLSGSSPVLPSTLLAFLKLGGRFIGIIGQAPTMQLVLAHKTAQGEITSTPLFETHAPCLQNAPNAPAFVF
jgi:protein-L-isoaspartate(D-aspartate) O-methyltransferase